MMQKEQNKFADSNIFEGMTSISAVLNSCDCNDRTIERIWVDQAKRHAKSREIGYLTAKSKELGFFILKTKLKTSSPFVWAGYFIYGA